MFYELLGRMLYVLLVAAISMSTLGMLGRGVQVIKHFGWNSRRGLWGWNAILAALMGGYLLSLFIRGRPLQTTTAAGLALGLVVGGALLVVVRPRLR